MLSCFRVFNFLRCYGLWPPRLLYPWDSPGKNPGVGYHDLLQGIFPSQGSNLVSMSPALAVRFCNTSTTSLKPKHTVSLVGHPLT